MEEGERFELSAPALHRGIRFQDGRIKPDSANLPMAEIKGFEPLGQVALPNGLANRRFQPLSHISNSILQRSQHSSQVITCVFFAAYY
jgi:hypothetical protein